MADATKSGHFLQEAGQVFHFPDLPRANLNMPVPVAAAMGKWEGEGGDERDKYDIE